MKHVQGFVNGIPTSNDWFVSIEYTNHNGDVIESTFNTSQNELLDIAYKLADELRRCASCHHDAHLLWKHRGSRHTIG